MLYAVAYTLKMSEKAGYKIDGFFAYVVPPLEGFWWQEGMEGVVYTEKQNFDSEPETVAQMEKYQKQQGYENDFGNGRLHHEIYLSDADVFHLKNGKR